MENSEIFLKENRQRIWEGYQQLTDRFPELFETLEERFDKMEEDTALAMKYLYITMPWSDMGNYSFDTFLDFAAHGVFLWKTDPQVCRLPEQIFLNYVLYHRVNEEEIAPCRRFFYKQLHDRLEGLEGEEAVMEVNYWCAQEVTYQLSDDRTLSAMAVYRRGNGRCGEESVFTVNAMRSAGIPARQVYAPRWSHCDDNHAWVEIWCNGTWVFTGACEPEPVLNKGWFTNAASRAMMVHSRWFDSVKSEEEKIGKEGMVTMLNELARYALVKRIWVFIVDEEHLPVEKAKVSFEIINYSEYTPIAAGRTDEKGTIELATGLGSLHIFVKKGTLVGEGFMDTRKENSIIVTLKEDLEEEGWKTWDMFAPADSPVNRAAPSKEQAELGKQRLSLAVEKRKAKMADWKHPEREAFLLKDMEDNYSLRLALMNVLTEKDQTDCICQVLEEHLKYGIAYKDQYEEDIFVSYVLNPRVDHEVLTKYREAILSKFPKIQQGIFQSTPEKIWEYIEDTIISCPDQERESLITTPSACLKLGVGSQLSKEILFVAIARTLGIPSRLNPSDRSIEYMKNGVFTPVLKEAVKNCRLVLVKEEEAVWKYFQNWSIARMSEDGFTSLKLEDKIWDKSRLPLHLEAGRYRILTSNRLPNGNLFAYQYDFVLESGEEKIIKLLMRNANLSDMLENISIPEFSLYGPEGEEFKGSALTEDGKHILIFLEESKEPAEHILNELVKLRKEYRRHASRILFVFRSKEALRDSAVSKVLKALPEIKVYYDDFKENINMLGRRMYVDHEKLPLIIVTNGRLNGIYAASGYNVGTGDMLLRLM